MSLTFKFGLFSAMLAALLGVGLSAWLSHFIYESNLNQAEKTASYSMQLALNAAGLTQHQTGPLTGAQYAEVTKLLDAMVASGSYEAAVAWDAAGAVAYAAEQGRVGRHEPARPQVAQALHGQTASVVISSLDSRIPDPTEHRTIHEHGATLESFVPVRVAGRVVAAVEFYQQWRPVQRQINRDSLQAFGLIAIGLVALWAGLLRLVSRASTQLRRQARENWRLASYDPLTGLPNRQLLQERAAQALKRAVRQHEGVALLLLDLDRFKEVNDTLGHHAGDLLLREVADRLSGLLRDEDTVARLGGDEFVVLLTSCAETAPTAAAKRILESLQQPFQLAHLAVEVDASIGIAYCPQHGLAFDELLQHADTAMYAAKASGDGFAVYSPKRDETNPSRLALPGELREALAATDQIVLHYQPIAALSTGETVGFEALVRWHHPAQGLLQPAGFIAVAEATGLIQPLTDRVLALAVEQLRIWNHAGLRTTVSVNISARCLNRNLFDRVKNLLSQHDIDADQLELEVTESALMVDPEGAIVVLTKLRHLGVSVSIDDFGTGYSSLAYLKRLPVQKIKVDRSFVADLLTDDTDRTIVEACLKFGTTLSLAIVAEGVEDEDVWQFLRAAGCDYAQGFLLARPMPAEDVPAWIFAYETGNLSQPNRSLVLAANRT